MSKVNLKSLREAVEIIENNPNFGVNLTLLNLAQQYLLMKCLVSEKTETTDYGPSDYDYAMGWNNCLKRITEIIELKGDIT